jgi:hypothetical protein
MMQDNVSQTRINIAYTPSISTSTSSDFLSLNLESLQVVVEMYGVCASAVVLFGVVVAHLLLFFE